MLTLPDQGGLIFTRCPGTKGVALAASISQLHRAGADAVVTMMTDEELARFEVTTLPDVVRQSGMAWFHFSVEDDAAPGQAFEPSWQVHESQVLTLDRAGQLCGDSLPGRLGPHRLHGGGDFA